MKAERWLVCALESEAERVIRQMLESGTVGASAECVAQCMRTGGILGVSQAQFDSALRVALKRVRVWARRRGFSLEV